MNFEKKTLCIVGLGYVGYPLAIAFSDHIKTIGFDVNENRIKELKNNGNSKIVFTSDSRCINESDYVCICVPTPITKAKSPDLSYILSAGEIIGRNLKKGAIIILESTVYPGLTQEILVPILENYSKYTCGIDFSVGYSPERINPGDDEHHINNIIKIVSGINKKTTDELVQLYGLITTPYAAESIEIAEAAKVIENIQRDINIALINELSLIFFRMGIDVQAVIKAAGTKWNFHKYYPGLVGGHCIPVDPYYLVYKAEEVGYHPQIILSGRKINDDMPKFVAELTIKALNDIGKPIKGSTVVIAGLTYKDDVADIRESPVHEIVNELKEFHIDIYGYDPLVDNNLIKEFGITPITSINFKPDCLIYAANHKQFQSLTLNYLKSIMQSNPVLIDVRRHYSPIEAKNLGFEYRTI